MCESVFWPGCVFVHVRALCGYSVFIRMHAYKNVWKSDDNKRDSACNRCSSRLDLICYYQQAQCIASGISCLENSTDLGRTASARLQLVENIECWGFSNCCVGDGGWKLRSNSSREQSQHCYQAAPRPACQHTCFLLGFREEKRWRGVRLG